MKKMLTVDKKTFKKGIYIRFLFLLMFGLFISFSGEAQHKMISIKADKESLSSILKKIEKQTDYLFFYNIEDVNPHQKLTINKESSDIKVIMDALSEAANMSYSIKDKHVVLSKKKDPKQAVNTSQYSKTIYGIVIDAKDRPILGVTVAVKGSTKGTVTDAQGKYAIKASPDDILTFSFLGFTSQSIRVGEKTEIDIELQEDLVTLDDIVVIGYGEVRKSDLTGAVGQVKMRDIESIPVSSVDQMLQGRVAGVDVMSTSGEPGATTSIRVRGTRSINASNEPLYIVDGVIDAIADLNDINPSDIESIEILKDASSTAIYGSRGSNGVIIITTKQGKFSSEDRITFKADIGFSQLPKNLDLMDATEFANFRNDYFFLNNNDAPNMPLEKYPYPDPMSFGKGTNWTDEITRTAPYQNYFLSASGGEKTYTYYISGSYNDTQGIIKNSGQKRWQGRIKFDKKFGKYITSGLNIQYTHIDEDLNKADVGTTSNWYRSAHYLAPVIPVYNEDGTLNNWNNFSNMSGGAIFDSPVAYVKQMTKNAIRKTFSFNWHVTLEPIKDLKIRSYISYYDYSRNSDYYWPGTMPTREFAQSGGKAYRALFLDNNILNENTVTYKKSWNKTHNLDLLGGYTCQKFWNSSIGIEGEGYLVDELGTDDLDAISNKNSLKPTSGKSHKIKLSGLFRLNYNYKSKYYLTFTMRADGASNFAANHKWGYFPSAAVKWNIKKEKIMDKVKWLNDFSLRLSAGLSGNDAIGNYQSLNALYSSSGGYIFGGSIPVSFYPGRIANDELTWEKTTSYNIGLDLSFFNKRLQFTVDAYLNETKDLLLSVQKPIHTGFQNRLMNIGKTDNKGIEITVTSRNIRRNRFSWDTTITLSKNKQTVRNIGGEDMVVAFAAPTSGYEMMGYKEGYPLNSLWGFRYGGTWKNGDEVERNKYTKTYASPYVGFYQPGKPRYIDRNNDGRLDKEDLFYLGNADPDVYGGIQNTFKIYGFNLNVYFSYSIGGKIYNISELYMGSGGLYSNQYRYMSKSWHPKRNPHSNIPIAGSQDNLPNDRFVHDASFLRLKNLSLGYTFDMKKRTKNMIQDLTLSVSGNNVWLWKKYNGYDPEVSTSSSGSTIRRMDNGAYPSSRTIVFSLQLRY